jgi:hypothetical protein
MILKEIYNGRAEVVGEHQLMVIIPLLLYKQIMFLELYIEAQRVILLEMTDTFIGLWFVCVLLVVIIMVVLLHMIQ